MSIPIKDFTIKAVSEPECKSFLKIKKGDIYYTLDEFIAAFNSDAEELLNDCMIIYRGTEKSYPQTIADYVTFSDSLEFYSFKEPILVMDEAIRASIYFTKKARECLQFARFFSMKSALLLDTDFNLHWSQGYVPQYLFRCIYFGTASTWYSNTFDHILQIAYWGLGLYTSTKDRDDYAYNDSWDVKKIMSLCTYEFIVAELKTRGLTDVRKMLTACSGAIEEVRSWANYIKHKGGIDYKNLEAPAPYKAYFVPVGKEAASPKIGEKYVPPDERFAIDDFKSPIEVDIDEGLPKLKEAHKAIHKCLGEVVVSIDFDGHAVQFINKEEHSNE